MSSARRFAKIVDEFRSEKGVTLPSPEPEKKKKFRSNGLRVRGKIFAILSSNNNFVKLSRDRVDTLVATSDGERFDPRNNGKVMKEWIVLSPDSRTSWLQLAREAKNFVSNSAERGRNTPDENPRTVCRSSLGFVLSCVAAFLRAGRPQHGSLYSKCSRPDPLLMRCDPRRTGSWAL